MVLRAREAGEKQTWTGVPVTTHLRDASRLHAAAKTLDLPPIRAPLPLSQLPRFPLPCTFARSLDPTRGV